MKSFTEWTREIAERNNKKEVVEEAEPEVLKGLDLGSAAISGTIIWPVNVSSHPTFDIEDVSYPLNITILP